MKREYVVALDIGTSSVRSALFDQNGRRRKDSLFQESHPLNTSPEGEATLHPADLLRGVSQCLAQTQAALPTRSRVVAGGMSCFWHSLLGVDAMGRPLTRIITWADSRCRFDARRLREELDEVSTHAETGCMLRSSFWPAKLRWLARTEKAVFRKAAFWVSPSDWILWHLTGEWKQATGMATGTGLFDPTNMAWSQRMLNASHVTEKRLLPVEDSATDDFPWFAGIGDGAANNLGSGGQWGAINFGTSAAMRVIQSGRKVCPPFGLFGYRVDGERYLIGGAVSNAGNLRAWCLRELNLPDDARKMEAALLRSPEAGRSLTVLPFWTAERAPSWNEEASGVIAGITQATTALDLLAAITDASYFRLAEIAAVLPARPKWLVSGGILKSRRAMQRLADVLGCPLYANPEPEASLRGAAVYVLEKLGITPASEEPTMEITPRRKEAARMHAARLRAKALEVACAQSSCPETV